MNAGLLILAVWRSWLWWHKDLTRAEFERWDSEARCLCFPLFYPLSLGCKINISCYNLGANPLWPTDSRVIRTVEPSGWSEAEADHVCVFFFLLPSGLFLAVPLSNSVSVTLLSFVRGGALSASALPLFLFLHCTVVCLLRATCLSSNKSSQSRRGLGSQAHNKRLSLTEAEKRHTHSLYIHIYIYKVINKEVQIVNFSWV